jgi:hypothetical protein
MSKAQPPSVTASPGRDERVVGPLHAPISSLSSGAKYQERITRPSPSWKLGAPVYELGPDIEVEKLGGRKIQTESFYPTSFQSLPCNSNKNFMFGMILPFLCELRFRVK